MNKFIVISYYTRNTPYEEEAKIMVESLKRFNLEYDIIAIDVIGSWQKNTRYKAKFILKMLEKYSPLPIVWIDVDAVIKSDPIFLSMIDADVAFYYRTTGGRTPRIPEKSELISAAMYFKTNDRVKNLLNMWIASNDGDERDLEQHNLQKIIPAWRKSGGIHSILPQEYCKIFDSAEDQIAIVQNQASRRLRNQIDRQAGM